MAEQVKYPPGRWEVMGPTEHAGIYYVMVYAPDGRLLKQFHIGNTEGCDADARLIAAAPKLLAACEALPLDCEFEDAADFKDNSERFLRAMRLARAAIAKATGSPS